MILVRKDWLEYSHSLSQNLEGQCQHRSPKDLTELEIEQIKVYYFAHNH